LQVPLQLGSGNRVGRLTKREETQEGVRTAGLRFPEQWRDETETPNDDILWNAII